MKISPRLLLLGILTLLLIRIVAAQTTSAPWFSMTINAAESAVKAGSEIKIIIHLKNTSDHEIGIERTGGENRFFAWEVRDQKGNLTTKTKLRREIEEHGTANGQIVFLGGSVFNQTLQPGETVEDGVVVTDIYDLANPGRYTIQCQRFDRGSKTTVKSNKITVTVTP